MRAKLTINVYMTKFLVTLLLKKAFFVIYPLFSMPPIKHKNRAGHLRHEETPRSGFYFTFLHQVEKRSITVIRTSKAACSCD